MAYKRKYRKGGRIPTIGELLRQEFVYCYDKIYNHGWFGSWQLSYAKRMIDKGAIFYAVAVEDSTTSICKYCIDELCGNADCPKFTDFCPVPYEPEICRFEYRSDQRDQL